MGLNKVLVTGQTLHERSSIRIMGRSGLSRNYHAWY